MFQPLLYGMFSFTLKAKNPLSSNKKKSTINNKTNNCDFKTSCFGTQHFCHQHDETMFVKNITATIEIPTTVQVQTSLIRTYLATRRNRMVEILNSDFFDNLFFLLVAILGRPLRLAIPFSTSFVFVFEMFMFICCKSRYHKNR